MTKLEQMLEADEAFAEMPGPFDDFSVHETITRLCGVVKKLEKMVPHSALCITNHDCDLGDNCRHKSKTCSCMRQQHIDDVLND